VESLSSRNEEEIIKFPIQFAAVLIPTAKLMCCGGNNSTQENVRQDMILKDRVITYQYLQSKVHLPKIIRFYQ